MLAGNTLWQRAVQEVGPSRTLIYLYLEPFIVLVIARTQSRSQHPQVGMTASARTRLLSP